MRPDLETLYGKAQVLAHAVKQRGICQARSEQGKKVSKMYGVEFWQAIIDVELNCICQKPFTPGEQIAFYVPEPPKGKSMVHAVLRFHPECLDLCLKPLPDHLLEMMKQE
jgi:hypothetical protein